MKWRQVCGTVGVWHYGCVDVWQWVCGTVGVWWCGCVDVWQSVIEGVWQRVCCREDGGMAHW